MLKRTGEGRVFSREEVLVLAGAYEAVCKRLNVQRSDSDVRHNIARTLIGLAGKGVLDFKVLTERAFVLLREEREVLSSRQHAATPSPDRGP